MDYSPEVKLKLIQYMDTGPKYYKIEFSINEKRFPCVVKHIPGNRHWLCIYLNKDNKNDWFVRNEVFSQKEIDHGLEIEEVVFQNMWNRIKNIVDGQG